jgi:hypothetical protein
MSFPTSPASGQVFTATNGRSYTYNSVTNAWELQNTTTLRPAVTPSATPPVSPKAGDFWLDTLHGITFMYMSDGVTSAWLDISPPGTSETSGTFNFPPSPSIGATYTAPNGVTYVFQNGGWAANCVYIKNYIDNGSTITLITPPPDSGNNFYVNASIGNDANDGLSNVAGHAFATLQGAINVISSKYITPLAINLHVADGTYTGFTLNQSFVGNWNFIGNASTPASVIINSPIGANAGRGALTYNGTTSSFNGFTFQSFYENLVCVGGRMTVTNCTFTGTANAPSVGAYNGGNVYLLGTINYSGNGLAFCEVQTAGTMSVGYYDLAQSGACVITLSGTPAFSAGFVIATMGGVVSIPSSVTTFVGSATGPKFNISLYGVINTFGSGTNFLPGGTAGTNNNGSGGGGGSLNGYG